MTTIKIVCIFEMYFLYVYMLYIHKYSFGFQIKPGVLETVVQLFSFDHSSIFHITKFWTFFVCSSLLSYPLCPFGLYHFLSLLIMLSEFIKEVEINVCV